MHRPAGERLQCFWLGCFAASLHYAARLPVQPQSHHPTRPPLDGLAFHHYSRLGSRSFNPLFGARRPSNNTPTIIIIRPVIHLLITLRSTLPSHPLQHGDIRRTDGRSSLRFFLILITPLHHPQPRLEFVVGRRMHVKQTRRHPQRVLVPSSHSRAFL